MTWRYTITYNKFRTTFCITSMIISSRIITLYKWSNTREPDSPTITMPR